MSDIVSYVPPIVTFVAMFVGLLGPSRHSDRTGIRAITSFGWISCAIATIALFIAVYIQYKKELDVQAALELQLRLREVVIRELRGGAESLKQVLQYAALMPYRTAADTVSDQSNKTVPYTKYVVTSNAEDIDLRSKEVITVLDQLYLSPIVRMKAPVIPKAMPFGTQVAKPSMTVIVDESRAAAGRIELAVQKYAVVALTPEIIAAGSELVESPFLIHLKKLGESWENRSSMEDSDSPRALNFRFLNSGLPGGDRKDYLDMVDKIDRLLSLLCVDQNSTFSGSKVSTPSNGCVSRLGQIPSAAISQ